AGMDRHAVLVFRDQALTDEQQIAFTLNFGTLENYQTPGHIRKPEDHRLGPGIADFSNLDKHGKIMSAEDRVWFFKLGDRLWHSDSSFRPIPAKSSLPSGRITPPGGANTEFADMRAAYDALDARTKAEIEDLICEPSLRHSREAIGMVDLTTEELAAFAPVRQRLVRVHPVTGRKSLFLSSHARSEEHTSELQSLTNLVCRLLLEKKKTVTTQQRASVLAEKIEGVTNAPECKLAIWRIPVTTTAETPLHDHHDHQLAIPALHAQPS